MRFRCKCASGIEDGSSGRGLAENGEDEEPGEAVGPVGSGQHARRDESVVVSLRSVGVERGIHCGIVVDDAIDLDAKQFDIRLGHRRRDQLVGLQLGENVFRGISVLQSLVGPDYRDLVQELVGVDLPCQRDEEAGGEVRRLHAQRFVAEGLEVRLPLGHVRPSGGSRSTRSYRVRSAESLMALEATCSAL